MKNQNKKQNNNLNPEKFTFTDSKGYWIKCNACPFVCECQNIWRQNTIKHASDYCGSTVIEYRNYIKNKKNNLINERR